MKQTLNFENDAYRRLCGEILERRHPGRWIICGSIAATLTAVAVSLTMAAGSSTAAVSSPVRANASEPDRVTAYAELPPEIITRTHTETVTVPVTQELVTVVQSQPETLPTVAAVQETVEPETEPLPAEQPVISSQNPDFAHCVLRTERYTFVTNGGVFLVLDNETNKVVHFKDKFPRSMWWTGTELLMYSDTGDSYLYSPDDNTYTTLDSRELAELVQYQWTCNGERYSFYAYDNTLYRRQESNGKETALYQNPKGLKISCISGSYLFLVEKTDSDNYYLGDNMVSRVNLLTGEKERLFNCELLSYRGESGGDVLFELYCGLMMKNVRVHPDGTYESYRLYPGGYGDDQRATVTAFDRSEHTWTVDVTEELRKLVPDIEEWQMYNHIVEIDGDELFCCEVYSKNVDMSDTQSVSVVYIGRRTENGLVGGLHLFRDTPSSIIYADGHNAYYKKSNWNNSTGDYDIEIATIPYDLSASSDSAE